jgi:hypothetical protein
MMLAGSRPEREVQEMRRSESKQDRIARMAGEAIVVADDRDRQGEHRVAEEEKRLAATSTKTAKLRGLREAKEAAEREAAPVVAASKPESGAKTRVLRPGVRLRRK